MGLWILVGAASACSTENPPPSGSETSSTSTGASGTSGTNDPVVCTCFSDQVSPGPISPLTCGVEAVSCGIFDTRDGCGFGEGSGTGGGTGDTDAAWCDEQDAANAQVEQCTLNAIADGVAFVVHHDINAHDPTSYHRSYFIQEDGTLLVHRVDWRDLCYEESASHGPAPDLSGCSDWACIIQTLDDAALPDMCFSREQCFEG